MTSEQPSISALANDVFKLEKEIKKLQEQQKEKKDAIRERYEKEAFDRVDTPLGAITVAVSGGAKYVYKDAGAAKKAKQFEDEIADINKRAAEVAEEVKEIKDEAEFPKAELKKIQKKFGEKEIEADAKVTLKFSLSRG